MKLSLRITELVIVAVVVGDCVGVVFGDGVTNNTATTNNSAASNSSTITAVEGEKFSIVDQYNNNTYNNNGCDESKCVSTGLSWTLFNKSFTCYTDGTDWDHPMMCADGYKPRRTVENETTVYNDGYDFQYFTCCPPNLSADVKVSRHCSNSTSINPGENTIVCDDTTKPYPHEMKTSSSNSIYRSEYVSYVCCDSSTLNENENDNYTSNFLNETECVPYNSKEYYYRASVSSNKYGKIEPAVCDESENGFQFPRYVEYDNKPDNKHYYECCRTKQGSNFNQDSPFKRTVYPQIAISSIAVISSMVLIIALLIPLLIPLLSNLKTQSATSAGASANRSKGVKGARGARTTPRGAAEPAYSSYILYLVYLAIPDLMLNLYLLIKYGSFANPNNFDTYGSYFERAFIVACSTANLYFNCVVSYEILILLRNCHNAIRCDPPSLLKVTLQAISVYAFSIIVFIFHYFIGRAATKAEIQDDDYSSRLMLVNLIWSLLVTYVFPILFFGHVWITIKCRGYMPSATGPMKQLVWFFFRIVFVFCLIWLPGMLLLVIGASSKNRLLGQIGLLFCGIQPIVSTCMAMSKSDVRKYTMNLVTLSYIRTSSSSLSSEEETRADNGNDS